MPMIVVTGAGGLVGYRILEQLARRGECLGLYHREKPNVDGVCWQQSDLRCRQETWRILDEVKPRVIIHSAASCDPVWCEQNPSETLALNLGGTRYLAEWACNHDSFLVLISTDLVFDGTRRDYREEDPVRPISVYGWSKLAAEETVQASGVAHAVVRTALVYGKSLSGKRGCDEKLVTKWKRGETTPLFTDEMRTPTSARDLAEKVIEIADRRLSGLFHVAGKERLSRYQFGCRIAEMFGFSPNLIQPVRIDDVVSVPPRVRDASMDIAKAQNHLQSPFRSIEENLQREHDL
jgi:dTDP-4-dehydrorhamnose reductase